MADQFVLLPPREGEAPLFCWRSGKAWMVGRDLPATRAVQGETTVAFAPGPSVTRHRVQAVGRKFSEVRQTALFALEDEVAEPVEQLHIALGPAGESNERDVLVTGSRDISDWIALLSARGLQNADIVATHSLMAPDIDAFESPSELLFRSRGRVFALDPEVPDELLHSLTPDPLKVVYGQNLAARLGVKEAGTGASTPEAWLEMLAGAYEDAEAGDVISLRQGVFAVRRQINLDAISRWRPIAALAAAAALLWLAGVWMETSALRTQTDELRTETATIVNAAVPTADGNIGAALTVLRQRQQTAGVQLRPTITSAALYEAIGPESDAEIRSLRYDAANGQLTALVLFETYAEADAIAERLEASGLGVSLGQARQTGSRVLGEFVIEAVS